MSRTDLGLAGALVAFALTEEFVAHQPGNWWPLVLAAFAPLVALRRIAPLTALLANCVAGLKYWYPDQVVNYRLWQLAAMIIAAYTVGRHVPILGADGWRARARGIAGLLLTFATGSVFWQVDPVYPMGAFFFPFAPWLLGAAFAVQHRQSSDAAAARAAIREQRVREAVMEERVRIARELHDVVAHSVTVMVDPGRRGPPPPRRRPDRRRGPAAQHRVPPAATPSASCAAPWACCAATPAAPPPPRSAWTAPRRARSTRSARPASRSTFRREGAPVTLLPAADLSAYRIVQEALTNVLKHAGPAKVTVELRYAADGVDLSVVDYGGARGAPALDRRWPRPDRHARARRAVRRRPRRRPAPRRRLRRARPLPLLLAHADGAATGASASIRVVIADDQAHGPRRPAHGHRDRVRHRRSSARPPTAPSAVALARRLRPDVVLMDIAMPRHGRPHRHPRRCSPRPGTPAGRSSSPRSTPTSTCTTRCAPAPAASC